MTMCPFQRGLRRRPAPELRGHRGVREARQEQRPAVGAPVAGHRQADILTLKHKIRIPRHCWDVLRVSTDFLSGLWALPLSSCSVIIYWC